MDIATEIAELFLFGSDNLVLAFFGFVAEFSHNPDMQRDAEIKEIE